MATLTKLNAQKRENMKLANTYKKWKDKMGVSTPYTAGEMAIPQRTLEGVEQGRGFRYPSLLIDAMAMMSLDDMAPVYARDIVENPLDYTIISWADYHALEKAAGLSEDDDAPAGEEERQS